MSTKLNRLKEELGRALERLKAQQERVERLKSEIDTVEREEIHQIVQSANLTPDLLNQLLRTASLQGLIPAVPGTGDAGGADRAGNPVPEEAAPAESGDSREEDQEGGETLEENGDENGDETETGNADAAQG